MTTMTTELPEKQIADIGITSASHFIDRTAGARLLLP